MFKKQSLGAAGLSMFGICCVVGFMFLRDPICDAFVAYDESREIEKSQSDNPPEVHASWLRWRGSRHWEWREKGK